MMLPLIATAMSEVLRRSVRERQLRAALLFAIGYLAVWWCVVDLMAIFAIVLQAIFPNASYSFFGIATGVCVLWQGTRQKRRFANQCHVLPASPVSGFAAEAGSVRSGVRIAIRCLGTCWGFMNLTFFAGSAHLLIMAGLALFMVSERYGPPRWAKRDLRYIGGGAVMITVGIGTTLSIIKW